MKTLCIGEILWDIIGGVPFLGGAPLNAAAHLAQFGAESYLLSAVGNDELGQKALARLTEAGVRPDYIAVREDAPTGTALVFPEKEGSDRFLLPENVAYDRTALPEGPLPAFNGLVYGTLASFRSNSVKQAVLALAKANPQAEKLYDVNLRLSFYDRALLEELLALCTVCKVNDEEAGKVGALLFGEEMTEAGFAEKALAAFPSCRVILVTKGGNGAAAYVRGQGVYAVEGQTVDVCDTVGAGDAFAAAFLALWLRTGDVKKALSAGNAAGAFTASKPGAFPAYDDGFVETLLR